MINIKLLEQDDIVQEGQWCRPLARTQGHEEQLWETSPYSGSPINNFKWVKIERVLGECWFGKTLGEIHDRSIGPFEVAVGDIPESHILEVNTRSEDGRID